MLGMLMSPKKATMLLTGKILDRQQRQMQAEATPPSKEEIFQACGEAIMMAIEQKDPVGLSKAVLCLLEFQELREEEGEQEDMD